jgi:hypothetical protein
MTFRLSLAEESGAAKAKLIIVAIVSQFQQQESAPAWPRQFLR